MNSHILIYHTIFIQNITKYSFAFAKAIDLATDINLLTHYAKGTS